MLYNHMESMHSFRPGSKLSVMIFGTSAWDIHKCLWSIISSGINLFLVILVIKQSVAAVRWQNLVAYLFYLQKICVMNHSAKYIVICGDLLPYLLFKDFDIMLFLLMNAPDTHGIFRSSINLISFNVQSIFISLFKLNSTRN